MSIALGAGCGGGGSDPAPTVAPTPAVTADSADLGVLSEGRSVYLQRCVGCHGLDGSGIVGPDIRPGSIQDSYTSAEALTDLIRHGRGDMPEFGSVLSDTEIVTVADYVLSGLG